MSKNRKREVEYLQRRTPMALRARNVRRPGWWGDDVMEDFLESGDEETEVLSTGAVGVAEEIDVDVPTPPLENAHGRGRERETKEGKEAREAKEAKESGGPKVCVLCGGGPVGYAGEVVPYEHSTYLVKYVCGACKGEMVMLLAGSEMTHEQVKKGMEEKAERKREEERRKEEEKRKEEEPPAKVQKKGKKVEVEVKKMEVKEAPKQERKRSMRTRRQKALEEEQEAREAREREAKEEKEEEKVEEGGSSVSTWCLLCEKNQTFRSCARDDFSESRGFAKLKCPKCHSVKYHNADSGCVIFIPKGKVMSTVEVITGQPYFTHSKETVSEIAGKTTRDLVSYLQHKDIRGQCLDALKEHGIDGDAILLMEEEDFLKIGIKFGAYVKLREIIRASKK